MAIATSTGASFSPWNTKSAARWLISAALAGEIEACAAASAGASLRPSPTISTLRPSRRAAVEPGDLVGGLQPGKRHLDAELLRDPLDDALAVAREQRDPIALAFQRRDDLARIAPQTIGEAEADPLPGVPPVPDLAPLPAALKPAPGGRAEPFGAGARAQL